MKRLYSAATGIFGLIGLSLWAVCSIHATASAAEGLLLVQEVSGRLHTPPASQASPSPQVLNAVPSYEQVNSILQQRCIMCHTGPQAVGNLRLDSYAGLMAGGSKGPAVVPRSPEKSELLRRIRGDSQPRMPMNGPPWLTEEETSIIEQWIATGAIDAPIGENQSARPQEEARKEGTSPSGETSASAPLRYTDVAPIFQKRCVRCHMAQGSLGTPPEGIRLDNYRAVLSGSERPIVVPGYPEISLLFRTIKGVSLPRMPMDGPPYLNDQDTERISRWIAQGARSADGKAAAVPAGANIRLKGTLTGRWALDGVALAVDSGTRMDKNPAPGNSVEVRAVVQADGSLRAVRIKRL